MFRHTPTHELIVDINERQDCHDLFDQVESLSYDYCDDKHGCEPPFKELDTPSHGTQCAGEIVMAANNNYCGVGIAYNAKFGGQEWYCIIKYISYI